MQATLPMPSSCAAEYAYDNCSSCSPLYKDRLNHKCAFGLLGATEACTFLDNVFLLPSQILRHLANALFSHSPKTQLGQICALGLVETTKTLNLQSHASRFLKRHHVKKMSYSSPSPKTYLEKPYVFSFFDAAEALSLYRLLPSETTVARERSRASPF
jgi:hypothetical protein